jgi:hypothetical protein
MLSPHLPQPSLSTSQINDLPSVNSYKTFFETLMIPSAGLTLVYRYCAHECKKLFFNTLRLEEQLSSEIPRQP